MVLRSVIGALAAVTILGAIAMVLPERTPSKPVVAPTQFGKLPNPQFTSFIIPSGDKPDTGEARLLKTAAYERSPPASPPNPVQTRVNRDAIMTPTSVASVEPSPPRPQPALQVLAYAPPAGAAPAVAATAAALVAPSPDAAEAPVPPAAAPTGPAERAPPTPPPKTVASLDPSPPSAKPASGGNRFNINSAPVALLDHIPGGGRIGVAIARRRPYASIDDLVRKRVLRKTAFERIRSALTVN